MARSSNQKLRLLYLEQWLMRRSDEDHPVTVAQMLAWSSNRGASRLGMMLGKARQQAHLKAFGFGKTTGIPLRGEGAGVTIGDGSELNNIRTSMGQGMTATALQLCLAYSAIANGGKLMRPILVKEIRRHDGEVVLRHIINAGPQSWSIESSSSRPKQSDPSPARPALRKWSSTATTRTICTAARSSACSRPTLPNSWC